MRGRSPRDGAAWSEWLRPRRVALGFVACAANVIACSLLLPASDPQCSTNADCTARGAEFASSVCVGQVCVPRGSSDGGAEAGPDGPGDAPSEAPSDAASGGPDWSCVGHVSWPVPSPPTTLLLTQPYEDVLTCLPLEGVVVQPCSKLDVKCSAPLADAATTNAKGNVSFEVPAGYNGYLLGTWEAGLPTLNFISPPAYDAAPQLPITLITTATFESIFQTAVPDGGLDPALGHVILYVADCNQAPAADISVSFSPAGPETIGAYIIDNFPDLKAKATDQSGGYAVVNIRPGSVRFTGTLLSTGKQIGVATGFVRASAISFISLVPSP